MFNPTAQARLATLASPDGEVKVVVIDDALQAPQALVELAQQHRAAFAEAPHNAYPGLELPLPDRWVQRLVVWFGQHAATALGVRAVTAAHARLALVTRAPHALSPLQRLPHRDRLGTAEGELAAACVLYLFNNPALGGTAFYSPRKPVAQINADFGRYAGMAPALFDLETGVPQAYPHASSDLFTWLGEMPAAHNRAIFYDGGLFHSSQITQPELLSADPAQGRLTLNGFFTCRI